MKRAPQHLINQALTTLEFYSDYAPGEFYQTRLEEVVKIVRVAARRYDGADYGDQRFLLAFADAILHGNNPGIYKSPFGEPGKETYRL